jgi:hypothetical protein
MKSNQILVMLFILSSCHDGGESIEYLEVLSIDPPPNSVNVEKSRPIEIELNRPVHVSEVSKIQVRYLDDTDSLTVIPGGGLTPPEIRFITTGPLIWKPSATVAVVIPDDLGDPEGRTFRESIRYEFTIAGDIIPFDLIESEPGNGDTVSVGMGSVFGSLTFSDYLPFCDSLVTITAPAEIAITVAIHEGRNTPNRTVWFVVYNIAAGSSYTICISDQVRDFERDSLPKAYEILFHTKP